VRFLAGRRGPIAARCKQCQHLHVQEFHRRRPSQTKAERASYFARKKAEGLLKKGKVKRGRPRKVKPESRTRSEVREQVNLMQQSDPFYDTDRRRTNA
jgi:hypothetical protein